MWWRCDVKGCKFAISENEERRPQKKYQHKQMHAKAVWWRCDVKGCPFSILEAESRCPQKKYAHKKAHEKGFFPALRSQVGRTGCQFRGLPSALPAKRTAVPRVDPKRAGNPSQRKRAHNKLHSEGKLRGTLPTLRKGRDEEGHRGVKTVRRVSAHKSEVPSLPAQASTAARMCCWSDAGTWDVAPAELPMMSPEVGETGAIGETKRESIASVLGADGTPPPKRRQMALSSFFSSPRSTEKEKPEARSAGMLSVSQDEVQKPDRNDCAAEAHVERNFEVCVPCAEAENEHEQVMKEKNPPDAEMHVLAESHTQEVPPRMPRASTEKELEQARMAANRAGGEASAKEVPSPVDDLLPCVDGENEQDPTAMPGQGRDEESAKVPEEVPEPPPDARDASAEGPMQGRTPSPVAEERAVAAFEVVVKLESSLLPPGGANSDGQSSPEWVPRGSAEVAERVVRGTDSGLEQHPQQPAESPAQEGQEATGKRDTCAHPPRVCVEVPAPQEKPLEGA